MDLGLIDKGKVIKINIEQNIHAYNAFVNFFKKINHPPILYRLKRKLKIFFALSSNSNLIQRNRKDPNPTHKKKTNPARTWSGHSTVLDKSQSISAASPIPQTPSPAPHRTTG